jgi:putative chitinase
MRLPEVMDNPTLLEKEYAFESAIWFFRANKIFEMADKGLAEDNIRKITRRINGGYHGLDDRIEQTNKIFSWIL